MDKFSIEFGKQKGFKSWLKRVRAKREDKLLVFTIYSVCKKNLDIFKYMNTLFYVYNKALERGNDMKLPYYWWVRGPMISWLDLRDRLENFGYYIIFRYNDKKFPIESLQDYLEINSLSI